MSVEDRKYLINVTVRDLQEADRQKCKGLGFDYLLESQSKIFEFGKIFTIISKLDYETYGKEQLCNVIFIEHSDILNEDFLKVDFEKIANDIDFNTPITIKVEFVENIFSTNENIFKSNTSPNKYYLRQDYSKENYAKWFSAFKHNGKWEDNMPIRANVTFKMENETEKVSFSNWNSEGVSSEDYNEAFSYKKLEN